MPDSERLRESCSQVFERGIAKDDPDVTGTLMVGLLHQIERQSLYIAGFLVVLGESLLATSARIGKLQDARSNSSELAVPRKQNTPA
jgi:hypothetical protein